MIDITKPCLPVIKNCLIEWVRSLFWVGVMLEPTTKLHMLHNIRNTLVRASSYRMIFSVAPLMRTTFLSLNGISEEY